MSFLSDTDIKERLNNATICNDQRIEISPHDNLVIGPCSIDLTLSNQFARFRNVPIFLKWRLLDTKSKPDEDTKEFWYKKEIADTDKGFKIRPNEVVHVQTLENIKLPNGLMGLITGRSTYSRLGLEVQLTQDLKQPGHSGPVILQIKNNAPFSLRLYPGMRIAQLLIAALNKPCSTGYDASPNSKYKMERYGICAAPHLDPELKNRRLTSKTNEIRMLLNVLLIIVAFVTAVSGIQDIKKLADPIFLSLLSLTVIIGVVRFILYFKQ
jgi:dCTP deaminase